VKELWGEGGDGSGGLVGGGSGGISSMGDGRGLTGPASAMAKIGSMNRTAEAR
jgi:hypothetical protein